MLEHYAFRKQAMFPRVHTGLTKCHRCDCLLYFCITCFKRICLEFIARLPAISKEPTAPCILFPWHYARLVFNGFCKLLTRATTVSITCRALQCTHSLQGCWQSHLYSPFFIYLLYFGLTYKSQWYQWNGTSDNWRSAMTHLAPWTRQHKVSVDIVLTKLLSHIKPQWSILVIDATLDCVTQDRVGMVYLLELDNL